MDRGLPCISVSWRGQASGSVDSVVVGSEQSVATRKHISHIHHLQSALIPDGGELEVTIIEIFEML